MTERPGYGPDHIVRGLSLPRRVGHLVAGLGGLATASTVGLLWATEPGELPLRTRIAFAAVIGIGMTWAGFAGWTLARRPLFAVDRVIAACLACGGLGATLTVVASTMLARARAYRRALLARRHELERQEH